MKYKVGDRVKYGSEICTVTKVLESQGKFKYRVQSDTWFDIVNEDEMIEGLVEELLDNDMEEHQKIVDEIMAIQGIEPIEAEMEEDDIFDDTVPLPNSFVERMTHKIVDSELFKAEPLDIPTMTTDFVKEHGLPCPNGYIFKDENGNVINATKIVLEKKKKEYPKTYKECCYVLGFENTEMVFEDDYRDINPPKEQWKRLGLMNQFYQLLICCDAYWKIAGDEMGLGKPWEPDYSGTFENGTPIKYVIYNIGTHIVKERKSSPKHILSFPTEEMRDAFYENFKEEIESCKELL